MKMLSEHYREKFGCKVYKLSLDGGFTCPNRDGTCGTRGCIFCAGDGSGAFAEGTCGNLLQQMEQAKRRVESKNKEGKYIAAICAAPTVFGNLSLLEGREATCYPSMAKELICGEYKAESVVVSDHIITSRGMGTAIDFSLALIELLLDKDVANKIGTSIVYL